MFRGFNPGLWVAAIALLALSGCTAASIDTARLEIPPGQGEAPPAVQSAAAPGAAKAPVKQVKLPAKDLSTLRRVITEKEVRKLQEKDPDLEFSRCIEILCRLNKKDKEYIREDMKQKRPLIVPRNFSAYKDWSPLPANITAAGKFGKLILVVKDLHFLGWYQNGKRVSDTYVCTGKMNTWTKGGMYRVQGKDPIHRSTYSNAYGEAAFMPDALHIYERVWIHTGDVTGPNCSHGCINVPIAYSGKLYDWAEVGTSVLITESLKDLGRDIKRSTKQ
ncbi:MAG TPA: L,D-transpeptidase [Syntrophobacteraceae bacterium]|nr:L,D-transpeptidase [Syntrophobacteraceae bacterium]